MVLKMQCTWTFTKRFTQARRQYLAAGWVQKPEGGPHVWNTVLDVWSNQGAKREMGGHRFQMGGRAPQLVMALALPFPCH